MPETFESKDTVAALFYKGDSLFVPPFEIAKEERAPKETHEKTFFRLCGQQGIVGYNDGLRFTHTTEEGAIRTFIMQPRYGELEGAEFLIPITRVARRIERENGLGLRNTVDKELILAAQKLLLHRI